MTSVRIAICILFVGFWGEKIELKMLSKKKWHFISKLGYTYSILKYVEIQLKQFRTQNLAYTYEKQISSISLFYQNSSDH